MSIRGRALLVIVLPAVLALAGCGPVFETDLQKAIKAHDAVTVKRLLGAGAPLERSWAELVPPGRLAVVSVLGGSADSVEVLRQVIAALPDRAAFLHESFSHDCHSKRCLGSAPVEYVARQRSSEGIQVLIDAGLDLRSQGVTNAVVAAIAEEDEPTARLLIEAGADVNGRAAAGKNRFVHEISILDAARQAGNAALVENLRARGAR